MNHCLLGLHYFIYLEKKSLNYTYSVPKQLLHIVLVNDWRLELLLQYGVLLHLC